MPDPTIAAILADVGDNPIAATAALHEERARPNPRPSLLAKLQERIDAAAPAGPDAPGDQTPNPGPDTPPSEATPQAPPDGAPNPGLDTPPSEATPQAPETEGPPNPGPDTPAHLATPFATGPDATGADQPVDRSAPGIGVRPVTHTFETGATAVMRAKSSFFAGNIKVDEGDLFSTTDPVVVKRPDLFELFTAGVRSSEVEEATAVPGEKRSRRPRSPRG